jgi:hypothetical protein
MIALGTSAIPGGTPLAFSSDQPIMFTLEHLQREIDLSSKI